jgi:nucleotide-binding universal stress UspA family protein
VVERREDMKPIMLATDGSPCSTEATREAMELAEALGATLVAVSVEHLTVPSYGYFGYADVYSELRKSEHEHAEKLLAEVAEAARERGVECETFPLEGPVVETLCRFASRRGVAMIIMGAHGWGAVRRFVFGSVSLGVLHDAPCPVLIAKQAPDGSETRVDERAATTV